MKALGALFWFAVGAGGTYPSVVYLPSATPAVARVGMSIAFAAIGAAATVVEL